jgi:hypothetical protein
MMGSWLAAFRACDDTNPCDIDDKSGQNPLSSPSVTNVTGLRIVEGRELPPADDADAVEAMREAMRRAENALAPAALGDEAELCIRGELP